MASNNQGIAHFGPKGLPLCRNKKAHIVVRELTRFQVEPNPCKKCSAVLSHAIAGKTQ